MILQEYELFLRCLIFILAVFSSSFVAQAGERLNDSLSPKKQYDVVLEWAHQGNVNRLSREDFFLLTAKVNNVEVRLDTSDFIGQHADIYLVLPTKIDGLAGIGGMTLAWDTNGRFSSGHITPGQRSLIFRGTIDSEIMMDLLTFTITLDAQYLIGKLRYAPIFEIETY